MAKYEADMAIIILVEDGCGTFVKTESDCWSEDHDEIDDALRQYGLEAVSLESDEPFPDKDGFYELSASFIKTWNDDGLSLWAKSCTYKSMQLVAS